METKILYTNVGCPVEVTGQFPLEIDAPISVKLPFADIDVIVMEHIGIYVGVVCRTGYEEENDTEPVRLRLYNRQDDCPDWNPDELTPGERIAEHTGRIDFQQ